MECLNQLSYSPQSLTFLNFSSHSSSTSCCYFCVFFFNFLSSFENIISLGLVILFLKLKLYFSLKSTLQKIFTEYVFHFTSVLAILLLHVNNLNIFYKVNSLSSQGLNLHFYLVVRPPLNFEFLSQVNPNVVRNSESHI